MPNLKSELERLKKNLKSTLQRMPQQTVKDLYIHHNRKPEMQSVGPNNEQDTKKRALEKKVTEFLVSHSTAEDVGQIPLLRALSTADRSEELDEFAVNIKEVLDQEGKSDVNRSPEQDRVS